MQDNKAEEEGAPAAPTEETAPAEPKEGEETPAAEEADKQVFNQLQLIYYQRLFYLKLLAGTPSSSRSLFQASKHD